MRNLTLAGLLATAVIIESGLPQATDDRTRGGETGDVRLSGLHALARKGRFGLGRKPTRKRMNRTLKRIKEELRRRMHDDVMDTGRWLGRVVRGWLNYYAVPTSFPSLQRFVWRLRRIWIRVLRRRSQKDRFSWDWLLAITNTLWPTLRIVHPWPTTDLPSNTEGRSRMR